MVLLRFDGGAFPVCSLKSAFCFAIAAAASGNMELIVLGSRPELRLPLGEGGGLPNACEPREPSMLSLLIASFMRDDIGSVQAQLDLQHLVSTKRVWHTFFTKVGRRQDARHGMALCHLLENLNEESDLDLSCLLQQCIQRSCTLGFTEDTEPLFDSTQLILEILIECCRGHLLQGRFVLIDVCNPL